MRIPKPIQNLIESFETLPGIGPKSAQRLTFYLLHVPQSQIEKFADSLVSLKKDTVLCSVCKNVSEANPCFICADQGRDKTTVAVVEQALDIFSFEKTGKYKGLYHVLHGSLNPLENIGPDEIFIADLIKRINDPESVIEEVIIATNPTMEGESTAMYLSKILHSQNENLKITRLGMGIPTGAYLEFADEHTLTQAIEGRRTL